VARPPQSILYLDRCRVYSPGPRTVEFSAITSFDCFTRDFRRDAASWHAKLAARSSALDFQLPRHPPPTAHRLWRVNSGDLPYIYTHSPGFLEFRVTPLEALIRSIDNPVAIGALTGLAAEFCVGVSTKECHLD